MIDVPRPDVNLFTDRLEAKPLTSDIQLHTPVETIITAVPYTIPLMTDSTLTPIKFSNLFTKISSVGATRHVYRMQVYCSSLSAFVCAAAEQQQSKVPRNSLFIPYLLLNTAYVEQTM